MEYNEWEMMFPLLILIICESLYIVFFSNLENVHRMECIVSENFFYDNDFGTYQSYVW